MIVNREGNKKRYAKELIKYFPDHKVYIEPFFGVGGIFFNKDKAGHNIINDYDSFIYELWTTFQDKEKIDKLIKEINELLVYDKVLRYNESLSCRVLWSYIALFNRDETADNSKIKPQEKLIEKIEILKEYIFNSLKDVYIYNKDIFDFFKAISSDFKNKDTFIYCDPPYCVSKGRLNANRGWNIKKTEELILKLKELKVNFAISEFNDDKVIELFKKHNLNIVEVADSTGIAKSNGTVKKVEIMALNYDSLLYSQEKLF